MLNTLKKIYLLLNKNERRSAYLLVLAAIVVAIIEVIGIGSIMPFLAIVANPHAIDENKWLNALYTYLNVDSINAFLIFLGVGALIILTVGNMLQVGTQWLMLRFVHKRSHLFSMRLLENYLDKPYLYFLNENSSDLETNILSDVRYIAVGLLKPTMEILSKGTVAFFIVLLLFIVNPVLAVSVVTFLGGTYMLVYFLIKGKLSHLGIMRQKANKERFKSTSEAFGAIKDIKLMNNQKSFVKMYEESSLRFEKTLATEETYGIVPDNAIQTIAFSGILIIVLFLLITDGNIAQTLPIVGLYGYSILRLKPALYVVYYSLSKIKFYESSLQEVFEDLKHYTRDRNLSRHNTDNTDRIAQLPFKEKLQLDNIHFHYPGANDPLFRGLNISIQPNSSVAFVGPTGSGKTTLVDIILGLLTPDDGRLIVDNIEVTSDNLINWQTNLGYVPQHIYLSDDSVARNIAFGISEEKIDRQRVVRSAKMAHIHDFIVDVMPDGYNTIIGERGIRLSGGQRQRIGIARALYRDPKILVLDEATSALDNETEDNVLSAIEKIAKTKTVIIIAHRLSTIKDCDRVYFLDNGEIVAGGTYEQLIRKSARFRSFTRFVHGDTNENKIEAQAGVL